MKQFRAAKTSLGDLDAEDAAALIAAASDIALIIDREGVIRDLAVDGEDMALAGYRTWIGKPWVATVTEETRPKVRDLLADAASKATPRWRQLNHPAVSGPDVPILYAAVQVGRAGSVLAVGRDLRAIAALQQRLVDAQQSIERDYSRLRHVETRYRLLFQISSDAVLIVDAESLKVVEANPAASQLLGAHAPRLAGRLFPDGFDDESSAALRSLLREVRASGRADEIRARLADHQHQFLVTASLFRQEQTALFLIRLAPLEADADAAIISRTKSKLLRFVELAPDGFVVTGADGRVITANAAFLELVQVANEHQVQGESLERWLGRPGVDLSVLLANLRQHGSVWLFATSLRGEYGATASVEISAVAVTGDQPCYGFTIRNVDRRLTPEPRTSHRLPRSVQQLTELVGRVPLKDLVRETTDVIERLCIEAALELSGDNRASAAEMLGLSRQSLYVKLRRYGLGDLAMQGEK